jgi:hypothetical protein
VQLLRKSCMSRPATRAEPYKLIYCVPFQPSTRTTSLAVIKLMHHTLSQAIFSTPWLASHTKLNYKAGPAIGDRNTHCNDPMLPPDAHNVNIAGLLDINLDEGSKCSFNAPRRSLV